LEQKMVLGPLPANEAAAQRKRLKQLWKTDGYTTSARFAEALGISAARLSNAENGHPLSIEVARLIKNLIPGVTLDWLYDGDEAGLTVALRKRLRE
jgi:transcriptional regulator with XRE-family HTH domain